jgi:hypothetical protein
MHGISLKYQHVHLEFLDAKTQAMRWSFIFYIWHSLLPENNSSPIKGIHPYNFQKNSEIYV